MNDRIVAAAEQYIARDSQPQINADEEVKINGEAPNTSQTLQDNDQELQIADPQPPFFPNMNIGFANPFAQSGSRIDEET